MVFHARCDGAHKMGRHWRFAVLACAFVGVVRYYFGNGSHDAGLVMHHLLGIGKCNRGDVALRAFPRPIGGPPPHLKKIRKNRGMPDGWGRAPGPLRRVQVYKNLTESLLDAANGIGNGALRNRYKKEVTAHLKDMVTLRHQGKPMPAWIFWDMENMWPSKGEVANDKVGHLSQKERLWRWCEWLAGFIDMPIKRMEMCEITKWANTADSDYNSGQINWPIWMRTLGGVVHRVWPPADDAADIVILDRIRDALDDMKNGGEKKVIVVMSDDRAFLPMLDAAQSEGATVIQLGSEQSREFKRPTEHPGLPTYGYSYLHGGQPYSLGHYYPGGCNFSIELEIPHVGYINRQIFNEKDPLRSAEDWRLFEGPPRWNRGVVDLTPAQHEEQDRRIFHRWQDRKRWVLPFAKYDGSYRRPGIALNDTLEGILQRVLRQKELPEPTRKVLEEHLETLPGPRREPALPTLPLGLSMPTNCKNCGAQLWEEETFCRKCGTPRFESKDKALSTVKAPTRGIDLVTLREYHDDLFQLSKDTDEGGLAVYINFDDIRIRAMGPSPPEMAGRVIRWLEGMFMLPARRVEVARITEPWERLGLSSTDWLSVMHGLGAVMHRVWPPELEAVNTALCDAVGLQAEIATAVNRGVQVDHVPPKIICILSNDIFFDKPLRAAQAAGISVIWFGAEKRGYYYPANSDLKIPINVLKWHLIAKDLAEAVHNPYLGGSLPGAPTLVPYSQSRGKPEVPTDNSWGKPDALELDSRDLQMLVNELMEDAQLASAEKTSAL